MKINEFIDRFTIDPFTDIIPVFNLDRSFSLDCVGIDCCLNCSDKNNFHFLKSEPWTRVQHCWKCNRLNVVYVSDRMGGVHEDLVEVYK